MKGNNNRNILLLVLLLSISILVVSSSSSSSFIITEEKKNELNNRPIIGILDLPDDEYKVGGKTHIPACYVKWIEGAGGRVVPIRYDLPKERLFQLFNSINGLLFTGGGLDLFPNTTYFQTSKLFYDWSVESNNKGIHFPLWGTCQGFQLLSILAGGPSVMETYAFDSENLPLPLYFTDSAKQSGIISHMPLDIYSTFKNHNITINHHHDGIPVHYYNTSSALGRMFNLISWNVDRKGKPFGSMIQARKYPFFGVQYHPERNAFEWDLPELVSHTSEAVKSMQYLINYFVNEARRNHHAFADQKDEQRSLIYQYSPKYTGNYSNQVSNEQTYIFDKRSF